MTMNKTKSTSAQSASAAIGSDVEVLYQKMGNRWFAFSIVNDEVFMGSITQEEIDMLERREAAGIATPRTKTFGLSGST
jgi:hypothetical protein